jgi:hypothetical protein
MTVMTRGKSLIRAVLVLGSIGLALSACAASGPGGVYANDYYDYPGYYDPGYVDSFGFVGRDRDHDRRHDHDYDHDRGYSHEVHAGVYGMHDGAAGMMMPHSVGGARAGGGEHGGSGGRR